MSPDCLTVLLSCTLFKRYEASRSRDGPQKDLPEPVKLGSESKPVSTAWKCINRSYQSIDAQIWEGATRRLVMIGMVFLLMGAAVASSSPPLSAASLPELLSIDWRRLKDVPRQGPAGGYGGFQDSDGGWLDKDVVLTAFGYTAGGGFLNTAWLKNTSDRFAVRLELASGGGRHTLLRFLTSPSPHCPLLSLRTGPPCRRPRSTAGKKSEPPSSMARPTSSGDFPTRHRSRKGET